MCGAPGIVRATALPPTGLSMRRLLAAATLVLCAACARPDTAPPPPPAPAPTLTADTVEAGEVPDAETLLYQAPTSGSATVGQVEAAGDAALWLTFTCVAPAPASARVSLESGDLLTVDCYASPEEIRNKIETGATRQVTVTVTTDARVRWSLRVQQETP
jgi:hypothetical protein